MDTETPTAEAVAVKGDKIIALGNLVALQNQFPGQDTLVDNRFADKVIMPGFIDRPARALDYPRSNASAKAAPPPHLTNFS